ncbi:hypothetical protein HJA90_10540 [Rhizobium bangladeshense]|uniref:hypothetical protein n=1 Tax=Rhizobium bangladeshense TaxID=1138189 RepID=UPI001C83C6AB|nr:hypothetical protein [Rhizobium bangladeshense]MBX4884020.1 hypothetical protein [Rhizobium bangladeshense]
MYPLLDHDDLQKSRKALLATSALLIVLHELKFSAGAIDVGGLKFALDQGVLVGFATVFLFYFGYVFILRAVEFSFSTRLDTLKRQLEEYKVRQEQEYKEVNSLRTLYNSTEEMESDYERRSFTDFHRSHTHQVTNWLYAVKRVIFLTIDLILPLAIASLAFIKGGSVAGAIAFLF